MSFRPAIALLAFLAASLQGADTTSISHPYSGITLLVRRGSPPEFPRNVNIHAVKIDTSEPSISFKLSPPGGTRDAIRQTTLEYLIGERAQLAVNASFYMPFPSADLNAGIVGFAASNGRVYSPFELPAQNYAIVRDAPAINIGPKNELSIVHRDPASSGGDCHNLCQTADGLNTIEKVTIGNAFSGSAQIVTNGVKSIPCYRDEARPDCQLAPGGPRSYSSTNSWYEVVTARTAIGIGCDKKTLVLFTVDAANGSLGLKVSEVADLLIRDYGVCDALNMDGGGSTSLAMVDPATGIASFVNSPSDNPKGRANAASLAVFARPTARQP